MDWMKLLTEIFEMCVIPLLGILSFYAVQYIKLKGSEIVESVENETGKKYLRMLQHTVEEVVIETNQTYVEFLKDNGRFDLDAQRTAFKMTYNKILAILNEESKKYLEEMVGDLESYITTLIEAEVNKHKQ